MESHEQQPPRRAKLGIWSGRKRGRLFIGSVLFALLAGALAIVAAINVSQQRAALSAVRDDMLDREVCITSRGKLRDFSASPWWERNADGRWREWDYFADSESLYYLDSSMAERAAVGALVRITAGEVAWKGTYNNGYVLVTDIAVLDDGVGSPCAPTVNG